MLWDTFRFRLVQESTYTMSSSSYQYKSRESLEIDVFNEMQLFQGTDKEFLPNDKVPLFTSEHIVAAVFQEDGWKNVGTDLISFISKQAPRIFLTVLFMEFEQVTPPVFQDLMVQKVDDVTLPWEMKMGRNAGGEGWSIKDNIRGKTFQIPRGWKNNARNLFRLNQYKFIAPVFGQSDKFRFRFNSNHILPYLDDTQDAARKTSSGFFGEVSKRIIHPAHISQSLKEKLQKHDLLSFSQGTKGIAAAIKEAKDNRGLAAFAEKEAQNLHSITQRNFDSKHIINPIAGYEKDGHHYLVFPWAEGGHLANYWETLEGGPLEVRDVLWVLGEFVGLCKGFEYLHAENCRHGDLKPENILWFKGLRGQGTLQIADLGLATFHAKDNDTHVRHDQPTMTPSGTDRYKPPQEDLKNHDADGPRSRSYEIWSLGCTMLELLIWLLFGIEHLRLFRKNTPKHFWEKTSDGEAVYSIDAGVTEFIGAIKESPAMCDAYWDLLELIEERLLVILVGETYEKSSVHRAMAKEVYQMMEIIHQRCKQDERSSYLTPASLLRLEKLEVKSRDAKITVFQSNGHLVAPRGAGGSTRRPLLPQPDDSPRFELGRRQTLFSNPDPSIPRIVTGDADVDMDQHYDVDQSDQLDVNQVGIQLTAQATIHQTEVSNGDGR